MSKLINVASFKFRTDTQSPWQELILTGKVDPLNGVPAGGTAGQILAKASATDYDTTWIDDGLTILSYGNSTWADFLAAYTAQKVVYCRASSNSNPASGSQTRLAFMAYVNNAANPTEVEFQYYRSVSSHSDSQQGDQVFVYKLQKTGGWTVTTRNAFTKIVAGSGLSSSYSNGVLTLTNSQVVNTVTYKFDNLAQYSPQGYYLYIGGVKAKAGIPSNATIISAELSGWSTVGTNVSVSMSADDSLLVIYQSGFAVSAASYVTVRFTYVI